MKKRVLSFLMACFMVVSTFIISKPLVHVHAVEGEQTFVEGENQWTLPENFRPDTLDTFDENGWPIVGNWRLRSYAYKNSTQADFSTVKKFGTTGSTAPAWWINPDGQSQSEQFSSNGTNPGMRVNPFNSAAAIVFTAPSAGIYEYSQIVEQLWFETTAGDCSTVVCYSVVKNGVVYATFTADPTQTVGELAGYIALNSGEEVLFVVTKMFSNLKFTNNSADWSRGYMGALIKTIEVKKVGELPEGYTGDTVYSADFDSAAIKAQGPASTKDFSVISVNNFTIMGYDRLARKAVPVTNITEVGNWNNTMMLGAVLAKVNGSEYRLFEFDGTNKAFTADTGTKNLTRARAVAFTAPEAGYYSLEMTGKTDWVRSLQHNDATKGNFVQYEVIDDNGNVLNSAIAYENTTRTGTLSGPYVTVAAQVYLNAGQTAYIISRDADLMPDTCTGADGSRIHSITAVKTAGPAYVEPTETELEVVFDGTSLYDKLGNVKIMGIDTSVEGTILDKLYEVYGEKSITFGFNGTYNAFWAIDPASKSTDNSAGTGYYGRLWGFDENGKIASVGGATLSKTTGAALVFTAPNDGTFSFRAELGTTWSSSNTAYHDFSIVKGDGTVLDWITNNKAANKIGATVVATVELEKGEQVVIYKAPHDSTQAKANQSADGSASVTITEINHVCSADTVKAFDANDATCVAGGNIAYYGCSCGVKYANADATEALDSVDTPVDEDAHAPADKWTTDAEGHWHVCGNGCGEKLNYAEHDWTNEDGVCAICEFECTHDWSNKDGVCGTCGMTHNHVDSSIDTVCNNDGTHTEYCDGCGFEYYTENCKPMDGYFCKCGYDCTVDVLTENTTNMIKDYFANGNTITGTDYITAVGPTTALGDEYKATQSAPVDGVTYVLFNLVFDEEGNAYLRHHFYITDDAAIITLNGEDVELKHDDKCSEGIYYFDQALVVGTLADAAEIAIGTQLANETIEVSFYSYIKIALENGVSADQETILRALYDLNEAAK